METLPRPSKRIAIVALVLIAAATLFQVLNAPRYGGWRRAGVATLPPSAFHDQRSARWGWDRVSSEFVLGAGRPAYLVADAGRLPAGEAYVSVLDLGGSPRNVGLRTQAGGLFSGDLTSFGQDQVLEYKTGQIWRLVSAGGDSAFITSNWSDSAPLDPGRYRLALTAMTPHATPPDITFVVSQGRGYLFGIPMEDWLLGLAGLAGYLLLRRWERRREASAARAFPAALQIVAWVSIWAGVSGVVSLATSGSGGESLSVLGVWAGIDLLRLRPGWRSALIVVFWLFIAGEAATLVATVVYGWPPAQVYLSVALGLFFYWQYRVLVRSDVKELFESAEEARRPSRAVPTGMLVCRRCDGLVPFGATVCPHCGGDPAPVDPERPVAVAPPA
jgi:MYXO-CTERM domain-containing protein